MKKEPIDILNTYEGYMMSGRRECAPTWAHIGALALTLTLAVTDPDMDTFEVGSTTGWDATGLLYIGRECVRYTSLASTATRRGRSRNPATFANARTK